MALLTWLESQYVANLSIGCLSKVGTSVRFLAQAVQAAVSGRSVLGVELEEEARQRTEPHISGCTSSVTRPIMACRAPRVPQKDVLLTGGTACLGIEISHQLLSQPTVRLLHAIVKAIHQEDGIQCLRQALRTAGNLWESAWGRRVVVWLGDLSQPRLGLGRGALGALDQRSNRHTRSSTMAHWTAIACATRNQSPSTSSQLQRSHMPSGIVRERSISV